MKRPSLIVFDLDFTLWPFYIDSHFTQPFMRTEENNIVDSHGKQVPIYPDVPSILRKLSDAEISLGIASRTCEIIGAYSLLDTLGWKKYLKFIEIYPTCKTVHFNAIQQKSGVPYQEMLFFDDEERNIRDVSALDVVSILVETGVTVDLVDRGLNEFANKR